MNNVSRLALGAAVVAVALGVGFVSGVAVLLALNAVLPPFAGSARDLGPAGTPSTTADRRARNA